MCAACVCACLCIRCMCAAAGEAVVRHSSATADVTQNELVGSDTQRTIQQCMYMYMHFQWPPHWRACYCWCNISRFCAAEGCCCVLNTYVCACAVCVSYLFLPCCIGISPVCPLCCSCHSLQQRGFLHLCKHVQLTGVSLSYAITMQALLA